MNNIGMFLMHPENISSKISASFPNLQLENVNARIASKLAARVRFPADAEYY